MLSKRGYLQDYVSMNTLPLWSSMIPSFLLMNITHWYEFELKVEVFISLKCNGEIDGWDSMVQSVLSAETVSWQCSGTSDYRLLVSVEENLILKHHICRRGERNWNCIWQSDYRKKPTITYIVSCPATQNMNFNNSIQSMNFYCGPCFRIHTKCLWGEVPWIVICY